MLTMRETQMRTLEASLSAQFEGAMVTHLQTSHSDRLGGESIENLQGLVRRTLRQAQSCGINDFSDCAIFMELTMEFGEGFQLGCGWAERSLSAAARFSSNQRAEALLNAAAHYLDEMEARQATQIAEEEAAAARKEAEETEQLTGVYAITQEAAFNGEVS